MRLYLNFVVEADPRRDRAMVVDAASRLIKTFGGVEELLESAVVPVPTALSAPVRAHLEWSWNYLRAEEICQDGGRPKDVARAISSGITCGAEVKDEDLILDFLVSRVSDLDAMSLDEGWGGREVQAGVESLDGEGLTWSDFLMELRAFPNFGSLVEQARGERLDADSMGEDD